MKSNEEIVEEFENNFSHLNPSYEQKKNHEIGVLSPYDFEQIVKWLRTTLTTKDQECAQMIEEASKVTEDTSDGYHTFKELYEFRKLYNACLFNEWYAQGKYDVHKSQRHNDGELCFGRDDYFIVVAILPTGQISNHYPMSDWNLFKCEAVEKAKASWDGHTSQDVARRLEALTNTKTDKQTDITNNNDKQNGVSIGCGGRGTHC